MRMTINESNIVINMVRDLLTSSRLDNFVKTDIWRYTTYGISTLKYWFSLSEGFPIDCDYRKNSSYEVIRNIYAKFPSANIETHEQSKYMVELFKKKAHTSSSPSGQCRNTQ